MSCPQCKDHAENSETYAFNKASESVSKEADKYAIDKLAKTPTPRPNELDLYMMYYRIEYTRLLQTQKQQYITEYLHIIASKYTNSEDLCHTCASKGKNIDSYFNQDVSFCFHEIDYDPKCANCVIKQNPRI